MELHGGKSGNCHVGRHRTDAITRFVRAITLEALHKLNSKIAIARAAFVSVCNVTDALVGARNRPKAAWLVCMRRAILTLLILSVCIAR